MNLKDLRNRHREADIYVIGSGKTVDFFDPMFFQNRITIGVNQGWANHLHKVDYMVTKYHQNALEWRNNARAGQVVVTRGDKGHHKRWINDDENLVVVDHNDNTVKGWTADQWPTSFDALVATYSSITTATHLAAYLGASNIFMVGADCGDLDGHRTMEGHDPRSTTLDTFKFFEKQNRIVKNELEKRYRCRVMTLLPFATPNMDGHKFQSHAGTLHAS